MPSHKELLCGIFHEHAEHVDLNAQIKKDKAKLFQQNLRSLKFAAVHYCHTLHEINPNEPSLKR
jgi:hypothetical protein